MCSLLPRYEQVTVPIGHKSNTARKLSCSWIFDMDCVNASLPWIDAGLWKDVFKAIALCQLH